MVIKSLLSAQKGPASGPIAIGSVTLSGRTASKADLLEADWNNFKQRLFSELKRSETELQSSLNLYYQRVHEQKPRVLNQKSQELFKKDFLDLKQNTEKRIVAWAVFTNPMDPAYDKAFAALNLKEQDSLIRGLAYYVGSEEMRNLKPCRPIEIKVDNYFRERIKNFIAPAGMKFLHSGSSGTTFLVEDTKPYVLKHSNQRPGDRSKPNYKVALEKANIETTHRILNNSRNQWLQKLSTTKKGRYLGNDEVLASQYLPGITLDASATAQDLQEYVAKGFDTKFLKDFIQVIFQLAKQGADLSALTHANSIYDGKTRRLNLLDFTGLANKHYDNIRAFIKQHPLSFTMLKMISDLVLLQANTAAKLREQIKIALGKTSLKQFMDQRFTLLCNTLDGIFKLNIDGFSKEDVIRELGALEDNLGSTDVNQNPFGLNFGVSKQGVEYIRKLRERLSRR